MAKRNTTSKQLFDISPRYIVDNAGKKTEVILDIATFEHMIESLEDLYFGSQAEKLLTAAKFNKL